MQSTPRDHASTLPLWAAAGGLFGTLLAGLACVGPFVAILLGVGGLGWLTRYAYLQVPASIATFALLVWGFAKVYGSRSCRRSRQARLARVLLWTATLIAVGLHVFEYLILPRLG